MAILDFFGKNDNNSKNEDSTDKDFTPKSTAVRGPGGKFISQKKKSQTDQTVSKIVSNVEPKEEKQEADEVIEVQKLSQAYGPFFAPFGGQLIKKFYMRDRWYFSIEQLMGFLSADPPLKPYSELKKEKELKELFEKNLKVINGIECIDGKNTIKILMLIIKTYNDVHFPGSIFSWLEEISAFSYKPLEDDPVANYG